MITASFLPPVKFAFGNNETRPDKLKGLQELGPYLALGKTPRFGFVFPNEHKDFANRLYLALKNGIGYFKGVETLFRVRLEKNQVFPVTGFSIAKKSARDAAHSYADAIISWSQQQGNDQPDLFFVIHPQTPHSEVDTPYYACKALLLEHGLLSQSVTFQLLENRSQFEWAAANIALAAFAKMGGVPWIVAGNETEKGLVIGLGRAHLYDPLTRQTTRYLAFTACFSTRGLFKFMALADVAHNRQDYLSMLGSVVTSSLERAEQLSSQVNTLTIHVPKEMGREENEVIRRAVESHNKGRLLPITVVKVTEEESFFAVDQRYPDGIPKRGTLLRVSDHDYMLYTEGRDEKENWRARVPTALRVTPQRGTTGSHQQLLRQIQDLSQVNWRGFNARSQPISLYYGNLIARILSHVSPERVIRLYSEKAKAVIQDRMWFL
jgi:hypothetical protein